jgi:hypothetical protein
MVDGLGYVGEFEGISLLGRWSLVVASLKGDAGPIMYNPLSGGAV